MVLARPYLKLFLYILSFCIVALGQPHCSTILALIASFCGYAICFYAIEKNASFSRFLLTTLWYAAVQSWQLSWLTYVGHQPPEILILHIFIATMLGLFFGLFTEFFFFYGLSYINILTYSIVWTFFEWLRMHYPLCGFTWNPVGLSLAFGNFILLSNIAGIYGLSFWVITTNLLLLKAFKARSLRKFFYAIALIVFADIWGRSHKAIFYEKNPATLKTLLVQTFITPEQRDYRYHAKNFIPPSLQWERIIQQIVKAKKFDLVLLPEGALPLEAFHGCYDKKLFSASWRKVGIEIGDYADNNFFKTFDNEPLLSNADWATTIAQIFDSDVVMGLDDSDYDGKSYSCAFLFSSSGYERYEKRLLLPIVEVLPFDFLKPFTNYMNIPYFFTAGSTTKLFSTKVTSAPIICYEETLPDFAQRRRRCGAKLLLGIANDIWYPGTTLAKQHFYHARLRAVENGCPLIRATNSGITGVVDCFGKIVAQLDENILGSLHVKVPLTEYNTIFTYFGNNILFIAYIFALIRVLYLIQQYLLYNNR